MKIYTRKGDQGETHLVTGERVPKHALRVNLYGEVDELNSCMGVAVAALPDKNDFQSMRNQLQTQQCLLFELGSELAGFQAPTSQESVNTSKASVIYEQDITELEDWIDAMTAILPAMKSFILPGGIQAAAQLHVCRTVCRRVERTMTAVAAATEGGGVVQPIAIKYINRLSDYFFVAARFANHLAQQTDVPWKSRARAKCREASEST